MQPQGLQKEKQECRFNWLGEIGTGVRLIARPTIVGSACAYIANTCMDYLLPQNPNDCFTAIRLSTDSLAFIYGLYRTAFSDMPMWRQWFEKKPKEYYSQGASARWNKTAKALSMIALGALLGSNSPNKSQLTEKTCVPRLERSGEIIR